MDPAIIKSICENGDEINMSSASVGIDALELILTVLRIHGSVRVRNCGGVMSLIELGAYLRSIEAKP